MRAAQTEGTKTMAMRHTASFLQTFHTAKTAAERTAASQTATPSDTIDTDPAAVAFVRGLAPRPVAGQIVEVSGWKVRVGSGLVTEKQAQYMISIANRPSVNDAMRASLRERLEQGFNRAAGSDFITRYKGIPTAAAETARAEAVAPGASTEESLRTTPAPGPKVTEDGIYVDPIKGRIFKAQFNKGQGSGARLYAKQLWIDLPAGYRSENLLELDLGGISRDEFGREWRYTPGAIHSLKAEWKLTAEQAEKFGALYGSCLRCGRDLTKESSIRNGMGSTCATKSGF